MKSVIESVQNEMCMQEAKWGKNTDRVYQLDALWLVVLAEEVGEAAQEVCKGWDERPDEEALRTELIQVAAVALSWCEAIDAREKN
jgi:NTP pyrophosphatase (non-canonical NTP hydrolase)